MSDTLMKNALHRYCLSLFFDDAPVSHRTFPSPSAFCLLSHHCSFYDVVCSRWSCQDSRNVLSCSYEKEGGRSQNHAFFLLLSVSGDHDLLSDYVLLFAFVVCLISLFLDCLPSGVAFVFLESLSVHFLRCRHHRILAECDTSTCT